jgi:hypothetical protein
MKNYSKIHTIAVAFTAFSILSVMPAFAAGHTMSTTTMQEREAMRQARIASSTAAHIHSGIMKGDTMIQQRINSLNALITRIQGMKNVPDTAKASLVSSLQTEISNLTTLQTSLNGDTSTTTVSGSVSSITKAYRVYALVIPQAQIVAAADRVLNVTTMLTTIESKVDARIASSTTNASTTAAVNADLANFSSEVADATTQANGAVTEVSSLQPDNGNTTVAASNTAALKDARSKISVASRDLTSARASIGQAVAALRGNK